MRILFVMDPFAGMLPDKDTSFAFMQAAAAREHEVWHCHPRQISNRGTEVSAYAQRLTLPGSGRLPEAAAPVRISVSECNAVLIRKDPPFDMEYLHFTQQLSLLPPRVVVANDPQALRSANEKLFTFHFAEFMPETLVSNDTDQLLAFIREVGGKAVVKPLDGAGGAGVMGVESESRNTRGMLDYVTREGRELALVQTFQPEVVDGDKRVLLLDGKLLGAIRRVPREDDIRANIHVGGRVEAVELTPKEHILVESVGPKLSQAGLYFVGLDLIAERLIEINVTSPTGIQELARLTNTDPATRVIEWLEDRVKSTSAAE